MFVGMIISFVAKVPVAGIVFLVLMVACGVAGFATATVASRRLKGELKDR